VRARAIFVGGTASHVGKSWMSTAICRHLRDRGFRVAPFKAQNMSNNSFPCSNGGEIGRAQVAQAEACGLDPEPDMNPVLLKPNSNMGSQIIVNGKVWKSLSSRDYFAQSSFLRQTALDAYDRLSKRFEYIVIEGAGSIAELNLKQRDYVNLSMAKAAEARALLVADIERGGVFAAILGTLDLLEPEERALVRGFAVNRFRGDPALFADGVKILEARSGCACLGVFPRVDDIPLQEEDSVALDENVGVSSCAIAIIRLPQISNFTDFRLLRANWISHPVEREFEWIIVPGAKNTIGALEWMRSRGLDRWILAQHARGAKVLGVCGGFQMLGESIEDPHAMEHSTPRTVAGLGLLPARTVLQPQKVVRVVRAEVGGVYGGAYEIHLGETSCDLPPFAKLDDGVDGAIIKRTFGTYLHGVFENFALASAFFGCGNVLDETAQPYYRLAAWFEQNADRKLFEEQFL